MNRDSYLRVARVYLNEARARRSIPAQRQFCFMLLAWAAEYRRKISAMPKRQPEQMELAL